MVFLTATVIAFVAGDRFHINAPLEADTESVAGLIAATDAAAHTTVGFQTMALTEAASSVPAETFTALPTENTAATEHIASEFASTGTIPLNTQVNTTQDSGASETQTGSESRAPETAEGETAASSPVVTFAPLPEYNAYRPDVPMTQAAPPPVGYRLNPLKNAVITAGFSYDAEQDIFYSVSDPWQRAFGFTPIYDQFAVFTNMVYDTRRFKFTYGGADWMLQIWKGRYGITTGAEMGIYCKEEGTEGDFYACANDENLVAMSFEIYINNELYMTRGPELHWWLTGFKLGELYHSPDMVMAGTYYINNSEVLDLLETAIGNEGVLYSRKPDAITFIWH
ncbi:MAG: DUF4474 domain-containing protein [Oscillospiraceae bacterium]|nr:DUF4474 domain-containing protein [Oscillospiraceae bacterium]